VEPEGRVGVSGRGGEWLEYSETVTQSTYQPPAVGEGEP
jgi:hypothetical protein